MNLKQVSPLAPLVSADQRRSLNNAVLSVMNDCFSPTLFPFSAPINEGDAVQNKGGSYSRASVHLFRKPIL